MLSLINYFNKDERMSIRKSTILILSFLAVILAGCAPNAPHENSLDPMSPNHKTTGALRGKVLTLGAPYSGIQNALVVIQQNGSAELTASDGSFSFANAPAGLITILVTKASYLNDTIQVTVPLGGSYNAEIHLDALPQISSAQVVTSKIDQWWPGPVYSALVTANVTDPDGFLDVDTVYVQVDSLIFGMNPSAANKNYQVTIGATQLPNQDLQWLVGRQLNVFAIDRSKGIGESPNFYVSRIIESEPVPTYPTSLDTTTGSPRFDWNPPPVSFNYTYQLQVVRIDAGTQTVVWSQPGLNSSYVSYSYPGVLPTGTYFWTAAIIDAYGNASRSKEASFVVP